MIIEFQNSKKQKLKCIKVNRFKISKLGLNLNPNYTYIIDLFLFAFPVVIMKL